jgi:putative mRNA 3-end processing factor
MALLSKTSRGLYCEQGDFFIDPWKPVERAVITHAHSDHARPGSKSYLTSISGKPVLHERVGEKANIEGIPFGKKVSLNGVEVSLHPAGHLLGSSQVRVEYKGEVWVFSGDYKTQPDPSCEPFELVKCHTFITESTFGLPIYQWQSDQVLFHEIEIWWKANQSEGRTSVLFAYALGKAQRILAQINASIGPVLVHGSVNRFLPHYQNAGMPLVKAEYATPEIIKKHKGQCLLIAPSSVQGTTWLRRFQPCSLAFASGWMAVRGNRRRQALDRGFVLSDHVDWPSLMGTIEATEAERIGVTHGFSDVVVRYLKEQGRDAWALETEFEGESDKDLESSSTGET